MKWRTIRSLRGLAADIENAPGTYGPGDYTHPKITAIGWGWIEAGHPLTPKAQGRVLRRNDVKGMRKIAEEFRKVWDRADFIVGHNWKRHDQKILDGAKERVQVFEGDVIARQNAGATETVTVRPEASPWPWRWKGRVGDAERHMISSMADRNKVGKLFV